MKTIAVFGASGLTAAECVFQALKNGDTVVGLTRYGKRFVLMLCEPNVVAVKLREELICVSHLCFVLSPSVVPVQHRLKSTNTMLHFTNNTGTHPTW